MAISPFNIATDGYLCGDTLSIVSNGYLCIVDVEIIPPPTGGTRPDDFIGFGGSYAGPFSLDKHGKEKVKKITITLKKDDRTYIETKYVKDLTIKAKDVKFEITEERSEVSIRVYFDD